MNKTAAFMIVTDFNTILYPPLLEDKNTDFFVFTNLTTLQSDYWQIKVLSTLLSIKQQLIENPSDFLGIYDTYIYIQEEQIITGLLSEDSDCIVSVPPISCLLPSDMDLTPPPQLPVEDNPTFSDGPYNGYPLQLSICLPMGNRCDTVHNCFEGLLPLLSELNAELIVVDSSNDGSTEIAKEYTDKIIPYTWCDDFSHARNTAIQAASGAWILSVDDDEWFESTEEIIEFFSSGEYLNYDGATYITRNYTRADGSEYSDFSVLRMAQNHPQLHYGSKVHEAFNFTFLNRSTHFKNFGTFVHHYSYAYVTDEARYIKAQRNLKGLLWDLLDTPVNLRLHYQLCNEVITLRKYHSALAYCFRLLSLCRLAFPAENNNAILHKNVGLVFLYTIAEKTNDLTLLSKLEALRVGSKLNSFQAANIYYILALMNFNNKDYNKAYEYSLHYYELRKEFLSAVDKPLQKQSLTIDLLTPNDKLHTLYFMNAYALVQLKRYCESESYFEQLDFALFTKEESYRLAQIMNCYSENFFAKMLPKTTDAMLEGFWLLCKYDGETASILYKKTLDANCHLGNIHVKFLGLLALSRDSYVIPQNVSFEEIFSFISELSNLDCSSFENLVKGYIRRFEEDIVSNKSSHSSLCETFLCSALLETLIFKKYEGNIARDENQYSYYFYTYVEFLVLWINQIYTPDMLTPERFKLLPANVRGALHFKAALLSKDSGDIRGYMNYLKQSVVECPLYKAIVKLLLKRLVEGI